MESEKLRFSSHGKKRENMRLRKLEFNRRTSYSGSFVTIMFNQPRYIVPEDPSIQETITTPI